MTLHFPPYPCRRHHPSWQHRSSEVKERLHLELVYGTVPSLLLGRCPVALASIFEPVGHLGQRQSSFFGQSAFLVGRRVPILSVAIFQSGARFLFETVNRLLAVPDRLR